MFTRYYVCLFTTSSFLLCILAILFFYFDCFIFFSSYLQPLFTIRVIFFNDLTFNKDVYVYFNQYSL